MKTFGVILLTALFALAVIAQPQKPAAKSGVVCPVSGETVKELQKAPKAPYQGRTIYLCSRKCMAEFNGNPAKYAAKQVVRCPVSGEVVKDPVKAATSTHQGKSYYFCCPSCKPSFDRDPAKYTKQPKSSSTDGHKHHTH